MDRKGLHMLAYDYPVMGVFWSMLYFFIFFIWIMLLFRIFVDIFRSHDLGGFAKTLWFIFVIIVPFLGVFIYVIVRGKSMSERDMAEAKAQNESFKAYVQQTASTGSTADELAKLADLLNNGALTQAEYDAAKAKVLS
jgi:Short C-terminal domain